MLAKRIVPCLDIKDGKTVKGINFVNIRDAGGPRSNLGAQYSREGADEIGYIWIITASHEGRKTFTELVKKGCGQYQHPFHSWRRHQRAERCGPPV